MKKCKRSLIRLSFSSVGRTFTDRTKTTSAPSAKGIRIQQNASDLMGLSVSQRVSHSLHDSHPSAHEVRAAGDASLHHMLMSVKGAMNSAEIRC